MRSCWPTSAHSGPLAALACHLSFLGPSLLSPPLFPFGSQLHSEAAQENSRIPFCFLLRAMRFLIALLSPCKPGPFTPRGHGDIFPNKEPAYVNIVMASSLNWGCSRGPSCAWCEVLALLSRCLKLTGILTLVVAADGEGCLTS